MPIKKNILVFGVILILGIIFRFYGLNWDQNQHLHPDERFLTMVSTALKIPDSFSLYLDPKKSTMNPENAGHAFFVYGTFPLTLTKVIAVKTTFCHFLNIGFPCLSSQGINNDNYINITLLGRFISGVFEAGTLIFIFLIARLLEKKLRYDKNIKFYAAFFYAIAVLPVQHAHFYVVDSFLVFFMVSAIFFSIQYSLNSKLINIVFMAILFGLGMATKITMLYALPLIFIFIIFGVNKNKMVKKYKISSLIYLCCLFVFFGLISYLTLRLADPKFFETKNLFDLTVNHNFINNLKSLKQWVTPQAYYPPGLQWLDKKPLFPTINIAFFGLGLPIFFLSVAGLFFLYYQKKRSDLIIIAVWVLILYVYQSVQYVKSIRYFYILYPFFSLFAGIGLSVIIKRIKYKRTGLTLILFLSLIWPLAFIRIYSRPHSRVMASTWIYSNVPRGSQLSWEYWDDPLPLSLDKKTGDIYKFNQMNVFDPDIDDKTGKVNHQKWDRINQQLKILDYVIFSSNRGYGSIATSGRKRYPLMSKLYDDLFSGRTDFVKVAEITSFPGLCIPYTDKCIEFDDQWSEETFTVYDHPKITIFKKKKNN